MTSYQAIRVMAQADTVLFDFDGPICEIFSGLPNPYGANRLRSVLLNHCLPMPDSLQSTSDSFDIFRAMPRIAPSFAETVERELAEVERSAAALAEPTPGADRTITALKTAGKQIGIVSNNSLSAVQLYVAKHELGGYVDGISARTEAEPALLKPDPHLVDQAICKLGADRGHTVLIGDQPSDIQAAHAAGIAAIGYANKVGKFETLRAAGAEAIITSIHQVFPSLAQPRVSRSVETSDEFER